MTRAAGGSYGPGDLLRPKQVAEILGCHLSSVYREMDRGRLPWVQILSKGRRIRRSDLEQYVERNLKGGWAQD